MEPSALSRRDFLDFAARCGLVLGGAGLLPPAAAQGLFDFAPADATSLAELLRTRSGRPLLDLDRGGRRRLRRLPRRRRARARRPPRAPAGAGQVPALRPRLHARATASAAGAGRASTSAASCAASSTAGRSPSTSIRSRRSPSTTSCPAPSAFSLATSGCPLRCKFCQNWEISQARPRTTRRRRRSAAAVAARAAAQRRAGDRLHLQRADRLHRVPDRHRARRRGSRACARSWSAAAS